MRSAAAAAVLLVASACGGPGTTGARPSDDGSGTPSTPSSSLSSESPGEPPSETPSEPSTDGPSKAPADGTVLRIDDSEFGPMLFDARGQAIYLFDVETTGRPECYAECAVAWPPVLTDGEPVAGRGVRRGLLGTTERRDGSVQVTYGGHPLYFYAHEGPGEVECHDVFLNGGTWYVVRPDGARAA